MGEEPCWIMEQALWLVRFATVRFKSSSPTTGKTDVTVESVGSLEVERFRVTTNIGDWCSGSTTDFDSVGGSSTLSSPAKDSLPMRSITTWGNGELAEKG